MRDLPGGAHISPNRGKRERLAAHVGRSETAISGAEKIGFMLEVKLHDLLKIFYQDISACRPSYKRTRRRTGEILESGMSYQVAVQGCFILRAGNFGGYGQMITKASFMPGRGYKKMDACAGTSRSSFGGKVSYAVSQKLSDAALWLVP